MKKKYLLFFIIALFTTFSRAQGLLNKLKNKANQEVNKLEKGTTSTPQTQGTPPNQNKLSANVTRSVVIKLNEDEVFDYSENCIDLGASLNQVSFIVTRQVGGSTQCYTYKNGTRTPVACPTGSNKGCQSSSLQCSFSELRNVEANGDEIKKYVTDQTTTNKIQMPKFTTDQIKMMEAAMTPKEKAEFEQTLKDAAKEENKSYTVVNLSLIHI